jgi:hypothetical protein
MNRFNRFSKYIKIHREEMGLKVFLPGDKKKPVLDNKNVCLKPIVITKNNMSKEIKIEFKKEPIKVVKTTEPIRVVKNIPSKELIIVKKDQEAIKISVAKKEILIDVGNIKERNEAGFEKKVDELRKIVTPDVVNVNVLEINDPNNEGKKPMAFSFGASGVRNIEVIPVKKVDDYDCIPEPEIVKEEGEYKIVRRTALTETQLKLDEDDPIVPIPKDISCPEKKISKEDIIEELCYHGEAMGSLTDAFEGEMVGVIVL